MRPFFRTLLLIVSRIDNRLIVARFYALLTAETRPPFDGPIRPRTLKGAHSDFALSPSTFDHESVAAARARVAFRTRLD